MLLAKITFIFCLQAIVVLAADIKRFVVDVDAGVEDYQALVLLIHADNQGLIKLEGIICTIGHTHNFYVRKNVYRLLETAHRTDIPVICGSFYHIFPVMQQDRWFGDDGFVDLTFTKEPNLTYANPGIAQPFLARLIMANPKEISVMVLAPCTDIAIYLRLYHHHTIPQNIKEIIISGGNYKIVARHFNVIADPIATRIVFEAADCPISMYPWDACDEDAITLDWRFGLKDISNPVWDILERAERKLYVDYVDQWPTIKWLACDSKAAFSAIYPDAIKKQSLHYATVDLENKYGVVVIDDENNKPNVNIIESIDMDLFKKVFVDSFVGICKDRTCTNEFL